jgi:hypothetical protein
MRNSRKSAPIVGRRRKPVNQRDRRPADIFVLCCRKWLISKSSGTSVSLNIPQLWSAVLAVRRAPIGRLTNVFVASSKTSVPSTGSSARTGRQPRPARLNRRSGPAHAAIHHAVVQERSPQNRLRGRTTESEIRRCVTATRALIGESPRTVDELT